MQVSQCVFLLQSSVLARCEVLSLPQNLPPAHYVRFHSSVARASYLYLESHGFDFCWGFEFFSEHFLVVRNIFFCYYSFSQKNSVVVGVQSHMFLYCRFQPRTYHSDIQFDCQQHCSREHNFQHHLQHRSQTTSRVSFLQGWH